MKSKRERLKNKAWKTFSLWIRNRDKRCITCGSNENLQAGHFWHGVLDFDEININAQCSRCNKWLSGNLAPYAIYLIKTYGIKVFTDLYDRKNLAKVGEYRTEEQSLEIINKYKI